MSYWLYPVYRGNKPLSCNPLGLTICAVTATGSMVAIVMFVRWVLS